MHALPATESRSAGQWVVEFLPKLLPYRLEISRLLADVRHEGRELDQIAGFVLAVHEVSEERGVLLNCARHVADDFFGYIASWPQHWIPTANKPKMGYAEKRF